MDYQLLFAFLGGVTVLLILVLAVRLNAFISLLIASICVGLFTGMPFEEILKTITDGMGNTLGFVATIVGLGAIFGAILEHSGATEQLSQFLLKKFGIERSPIALSLSGFLIAIPVFFDVAFIILVPVLYALQKKTGKSLLFFGIPLLASLAVTHAFIPPTPGPIAVADIVKADLGWIILFGFIVGIPTTIVAGLIFGKYISKQIFVPVPNVEFEPVKRLKTDTAPSILLIFGLILLPIVLILLNTATKAYYGETDDYYLQLLGFIGHPFVALIISTLLAMYFLAVRYGVTRSALQEISMKALAPAGIIILITGAGGVFKQMLVVSGAGVMLAEQMIQYNLMPILLAFILALIVRVLQGSATVAMITAAGIMAPILENIIFSEMQLALIVLSIAAGASSFSHVNDSGFWLVNRYLGLTEMQTLRSWTVMTGILGLVALSVIMVLNVFV
jgi:Gnt-I system low-affinity gluconate transporter